MKKTLFLIFSGVIVIFSVICIGSGPLINKMSIENVFKPSNWGYSNCKILSDNYKIIKETIPLTGDEKDNYLKNEKRPLNLCNGRKAMYGLEHASLIIDVILGCICLILGLLHYFDVGKPFEKITGIIGLATGVIQFVLTLVYVCYSGYIFTNDGPNGLNGPLKADSKGIFATWDNSKSHYKCNYYDKTNSDGVYANYNDLGKKIYNYDKDTSLAELTSTTTACRYRPSGFASYCYSGEGYYTHTSDKHDNCDNLYVSLSSSLENRYLYDRWVTTIIFACFIIACDIGLAIFGFLLFKSDGSGI
jgi:hypothetical protein